jgi:hypothetical protein
MRLRRGYRDIDFDRLRLIPRAGTYIFSSDDEEMLMYFDRVFRAN